MLEASALRVGNKFKSCFGQVQTVLSIIDNTKNGKIKVCADCPDDVPHFKNENHRLMYSHLILCEENGNQYKPFEIEGEPLTEEWLKKFSFYEGAEHYYINASNNQVRPLKILIRISESGFYISLWDESEEIVIFEGKKYYVSQLQNLYFAHKGEELILKN